MCYIIYMLTTFILIIFLLFSLLLLSIILSSFLSFLITKVPFVPTKKTEIEYILNQIPITKKDCFIDLGSGNGKVVFLVESTTQAKVIGYETTAWTYLWSMIKKFIIKSNAKFYHKNFLNVSWSNASVIYCYLYPHLMGKIENKFCTECKPGSMAIIKDFPFPKKNPEQILRLPKNHEIYIYKI